MAVSNNTVNTEFRTTSTGSAGRAADEVARMNRELSRAGTSARAIRSGFESADRQVSRLDRTINRLNVGLAAFATFTISRALTDLVGGFVTALVEAEKLEIQIASLTGSTEQATRQIAQLRQLSLDLGERDVNALANAYAKLANLGLDGSVEALTEFADLSAGLGRGLPELIEAVADASTREFERLKETFGIVARQSGDEVALTFRGVTTTIENTSDAIVEYLRTISRDNFAGQAVAQVETLGGSFRELGNTLVQIGIEIDQFFRISQGLALLARGTSDFGQDLFNLRGVSGEQEKIEATLRQQLLIEEQITNIKQLRASGTITESNATSKLNVLISRQATLTAILATQQESLGVARQQAQQVADDNAADQAINAINREAGAVSILVDELNKRVNARKEELTVVEEIDQLINRTLVQERQFPGLDLSVARRDLRRYREAAIAAAQETERLSNIDTNLENFQRLEQSLATPIERALTAYREGIDTLATQGIAATSDLASRLQDNLVNALRQSLGVDPLTASTAASTAQIAAYNQALADAISQGGQVAIAAQTIANRDIISAQERFSADLERLRDRANPFEAANDAILDGQRLFNAAYRDATNEQRALLEENSALIRASALNNLSTDFLPDSVGLTQGINLINAEVERLSASLDGFSSDDRANVLLQFFTQLREQLSSDLNLDQVDQLVAALNDANLTDLANQVVSDSDRRTNEERLKSADQLYDQLQTLRARDVELERLSADQRRGIAARSASEILGIFDENSRSIFELKKILDLGIIANDAVRAVSAELASPGTFADKFLRIAPIAAKFATLLAEVQSREFGSGAGTSSAASGSGGGSNAAVGQPTVSNSGNAGAFTVNIFGNVLDTNGSFRKEVVDSFRTALNNDEITERDLQVIRRT